MTCDIFFHIRRNHLVKEVVLRYAGGSENTSVRDLLQKLGIPDKWVFEAEALKAKYEVYRNFELKFNYQMKFI